MVLIFVVAFDAVLIQFGKGIRLGVIHFLSNVIRNHGTEENE